MTRADRIVSGWAYPVAAIVIVAVALLSHCGRAHAQQCGPINGADAAFLEKYNEAIIAAGVGRPMGWDENGRPAPGRPAEVFEVLVSPDGETFTILRLDFVTRMACPVAAGTGWVQLPVPHFQEPRQKL